MKKILILLLCMPLIGATQERKSFDVSVINLPIKNIVKKGEEFKTHIFLSASDPSLKNYYIYIGDYDILSDGTYKLKNYSDPLETKNGKGIYSMKTYSNGRHQYKGFIQIYNHKEERFNYYPFTGEYLVTDQAFTISPTQMNFLYANQVQNPITISAQGYQPEDIKVSFRYGSIRTVNKKKGEYIIIPDQQHVGKNVTISLSVKEDGSMRIVGDNIFKVRNIPQQTIKARFNDGTFAKSQIKVNSFSTEIPDFDFPIKFYITEFTVVCIGEKRIETKVNGFKLSEDAKHEIDKLEKGHTVLFKDFIIRQAGFPNYTNRLKDKFELIIK